MARRILFISLLIPPVLGLTAGRSWSGRRAADTLIGTAAAEILCGLGGNDVLRGGGGKDLILGGGGTIVWQARGARTRSRARPGETA